jgi:hypothetical protein
MEYASCVPSGAAEVNVLFQVDDSGGGRRGLSTPVRRREGEHVDRLGDVLEVLRAEGQELGLDRAVDLVEDLSRDADAAGLGYPLESRRDVDAVTVDAGLVMNDVAQVDTDAEAHAARLGHVRVARGHDGLDLDRAFSRADHARKFG